ncbi:ImmA/IrrE family metallo-endopeptidase [Saccharopolyspora gloriosae]
MRRRRGLSAWRSELELRRSVRDLLRELDLHPPLDVTQLCEELGQRRNRPIRLVPWPLPAPGAFGLWIATADTDWILYQRDTTTGHQEHIILHEVGHLISGHASNEADDDIWTQLFPDIPPEIVRRALRRDGYAPAAEHEAEMVATVIKEWAELLHRLEAPPDRTSDASTRIGRAFDDHQGWL